MTKTRVPVLAAQRRSAALTLSSPVRLRRTGGGAEPSEAEGVTQPSCAPLPLPRPNASKACSHGSSEAPPVDPITHPTTHRPGGAEETHR